MSPIDQKIEDILSLINRYEWICILITQSAKHDSDQEDKFIYPDLVRKMRKR